jgi:hypothetical protein
MRPWLALTGLLFIGAAQGQSLQESVTAVWVHDVPGPPVGDFWHPVAEHLLSSFTDPASIYPNVEICARPLTVATPHCSSVCWEFKGDSHGNGDTLAKTGVSVLAEEQGLRDRTVDWIGLNGC